MRFVVFVKADEQTEAGVLPSTEVLEAMTQYNDELAKAGVLLAGEGLHPSSKGARITFQGGKTTVTDGPFAEAKELVAGFWILQARSREEALEWIKRAPMDGGTTLEMRQVYEAEDFGDEFPPELRAKEAEIFERAKGNAAP